MRRRTGISYREKNVVQTLKNVCKKAGYSKSIHDDHGSEFISRDLNLLAYQRGVTLDLSRPGKPNDNSFINHSTASSVLNVERALVHES